MRIRVTDSKLVVVLVFRGFPKKPIIYVADIYKFNLKCSIHCIWISQYLYLQCHHKHWLLCISTSWSKNTFCRFQSFLFILNTTTEFLKNNPPCKNFENGLNQFCFTSNQFIQNWNWTLIWNFDFLLWHASQLIMRIRGNNQSKFISLLSTN